jgi:hypothetical protein
MTGSVVLFESACRVDFRLFDLLPRPQGITRHRIEVETKAWNMTAEKGTDAITIEVRWITTMRYTDPGGLWRTQESSATIRLG